MDKQVGFIGVGTMGFPMAANLLRAGVGVVAYDRRTGNLSRLEELGAEIAGNVAMVARSNRVILTSLPGPKELREVTLEEGGIQSQGQSGTIVIDFSTVDPFTIRSINDRLHESEMDLIDAPISGGRSKAETGTLTIMLGATKEEAREIGRLLSILGEHVFFLGKRGAGSALKLINNFIVMGNMMVASEAFSILNAFRDIDANLAYEIMMKSSGESYVLRTKFGDRVLKNNYASGFSMDLGTKDLGLVLEMGKKLGVPLMIGNLTKQLFHLAQLEGLHDEDIAAVYKFVRSLARTTAPEGNLSPNLD